jgi:hypothetical protein
MFIGDHEDAVAVLRNGIADHPETGDMRFLLSEQLLALGRYEEGWLHYLWRVNRHVFLRRFGVAVDAPAQMARLPESLEGKIVKIHAEQGIGDDLFFLRFAAELRKRGARIVGAVTPRLMEMVRRSGVLDEVLEAPERIPPSLEFKTMGDLPYLLDAHLREPPIPLRFAALESERYAVLAELASHPRPWVGLTWRAGTGPEAGNRNALYKEVPFDQFAQFAQSLPGTLVVLQRQPKEGEIDRLRARCGPRVLDYAAANAALERMHAVLEVLDDYVGVSNTNMHLCAALGRSGRVLVSASAEFRWMASGGRSPWFPGFSIYRQGHDGSWTSAFSKLLGEFK